jgi:hypothetical protein
MDQYVFHLYFHVVDIDGVDIILGYPLMESTGTNNINVKNKFLNLWSKTRKSYYKMFLLPTQFHSKLLDLLFSQHSLAPSLHMLGLATSKILATM